MGEGRQATRVEAADSPQSLLQQVQSISDLERIKFNNETHSRYALKVIAMSITKEFSRFLYNITKDKYTNIRIHNYIESGKALTLKYIFRYSLTNDSESMTLKDSLPIFKFYKNYMRLHFKEWNLQMEFHVDTLCTQISKNLENKGILRVEHIVPKSEIMEESELITYC